MKKVIILFIVIFTLCSTGVFAEVFVKDLDVLKTVELEGKGKAGKSDIPALRKSVSYDVAKKNAQKEIIDYLAEIKNNDGITLQELAQSSTPIQVILSETLKEGLITFREWDDKDNATVRIQVNLEKFKLKLSKLGVK